LTCRAFTSSTRRPRCPPAHVPDPALVPKTSWLAFRSVVGGCPTPQGKELTITDYEELRQRQCADAMALAPILVVRLSWTKERLRAYRTAQLRRLLRIAISGSPWHRRRLSQVDLQTFDETVLAELPTMTKDDLMEHFDEIVTDRRLNLDLVESHLGNISGDGYLLDHYQARIPPQDRADVAQPHAAAHPLRDHRPGDRARGRLRMRLRPPSNR
jgi:hypothetical protein